MTSLISLKSPFPTKTNILSSSETSKGISSTGPLFIIGDGGYRLSEDGEVTRNGFPPLFDCMPLFGRGKRVDLNESRRLCGLG